MQTGYGDQIIIYSSYNSLIEWIFLFISFVLIPIYIIIKQYSNMIYFNKLKIDKLDTTYKNRCHRCAEKLQIKKLIEKISIKQETDDSEELFINQVNELFSLSATKELIFLDFKINKLDKTNLMVV